MPERKCDYPPLVMQGKGRIVCSDRLFHNFRERGNCTLCPKVKGFGRLPKPEQLPPGELAARQMTFERMSSYRKVAEKLGIMKKR